MAREGKEGRKGGGSNNSVGSVAVGGGFQSHRLAPLVSPGATQFPSRLLDIERGDENGREGGKKRDDDAKEERRRMERRRSMTAS